MVSGMIDRGRMVVGSGLSMIARRSSFWRGSRRLASTKPFPGILVFTIRHQRPRSSVELSPLSDLTAGLGTANSRDALLSFSTQQVNHE
jgi:hypothetical protein